jgi:L-threonylcarbamoyladenylate synthase
LCHNFLVFLGDSAAITFKKQVVMTQNPSQYKCQLFKSTYLSYFFDQNGNKSTRKTYFCDNMETEIGQDIARAIQLLEQGQLVGIPTETVYGLAAHALLPDAVLKIFEVKQRPSFDPLICHFANWHQVADYVNKIPKPIEKIFEALSPGPLTVLLDRRIDKIPDVVSSGLTTVAVRVPAHPMAQELLSQLGFPLAAPSANPFGYISPTSAKHVADQLGSKIPYVLDGGACQIGVESTIIGMESDQALTVYRLGGTTIETLREICDLPVRLSITQSSNPQAPGQLQSHYAPRKPLTISDDLEEDISVFEDQDFGVIAFQNAPNVPEGTPVFVLSPTGNLHEAARNLFAALRALDQLDIECILAEPAPEIGLGLAINDRLSRAAFR